jgi:hypothetical protein
LENYTPVSLTLGNESPLLLVAEWLDNFGDLEQPAARVSRLSLDEIDIDPDRDHRHSSQHLHLAHTCPGRKCRGVQVCACRKTNGFNRAKPGIDSQTSLPSFCHLSLNIFLDDHIPLQRD